MQEWLPTGSSRMWRMVEKIWEDIYCEKRIKTNLRTDKQKIKILEYATITVPNPNLFYLRTKPEGLRWHFSESLKGSPSSCVSYVFSPKSSTGRFAVNPKPSCLQTRFTISRDLVEWVLRFVHTLLSHHSISPRVYTIYYVICYTGTRVVFTAAALSDNTGGGGRAEPRPTMTDPRRGP